MGDPRAAIAFEWTKIRTVRSSLWSLLLCFLVSVLIALLFGWVLRGAYDDMSAQSKADFDPVGSGFNGLRLGMISLVVFGTLTVTGEYTSGTIRASLAAVPRRGVFYAAKVLTGTAIALAVSVVVVLVTFFTAQTAIGEAHNASITDDGALRAVVGSILYMTLICAFSMGLATVLRTPALTLGILVPLFFMVSEILNNLPGVQKAAQFLPDAAGGIIMRREAQEHMILDAWSGMAVLVAWVVVALAGGYLALRRRDA
ncbi:ABC transporter permease subunit [Streptomyces virens]|jgi:ABC-2 type transport system permease protein|uniref:ABC-2 type transport system permease protein n=2 Tax=Streptomyces TaxID=1883 RepID=A0AA40VGA5_9ACTN|nr:MULTISPECIES: ABC transporter permease subunit [Streptomyces]MBA8942574.1 ABC-2 type transport system permease protein [Streptomyces calvus]MBA8975464.1 ABC-2 type transport system permease protein [Streptomyces calvus]MYS26072.1 ABC transporter permease subunit [Streptomyces sp. SID7804]GGP68548.1 ABC transporter [Streptomyces calvus]